MQVKHYRLISDLYTPQNKSSSAENIFRINKQGTPKQLFSQMAAMRSQLTPSASFTINDSAIKISAIVPKAHEERPFSRAITSLQKNRSYIDCRKLTSQTKYMQTLEDFEMNPIEEIQMRRTSQKQTINCKQLCLNNIENKNHFTTQKKFKKNHLSKIVIINHQGKPRIYYYMN